MNIRITSDYPVAERKLRELLENFACANFVDDGFHISIATDSALSRWDYALSGDDNSLTITGGSDSAKLCGVFEALGRMGVWFDISGEWVTRPFDLYALRGQSLTVRPAVQRRGIRQHINFPMDISCYRIEDALKYIDRIVQLQYNCITFHSYPGQWHGEPDGKGGFGPAGGFFYGQRYYVPAQYADMLDNRRIHCIPDIEADFEDEWKRDAFAKDWLRAVMARCHEYDMEITLSLELHGGTAQEQAAMVADVLKSYPDIDVLELISGEGGGGDTGDVIPDSDVPAHLAALGAANALDGMDMPRALPGVICFIERAMAVLAQREEILAAVGRNVEFRTGLYVMCRDTLRIARPIMNRVFPDLSRSFLPAHGAVAVDDNIAAMGFEPQDWQHSMLYSWAEFDGNMFIQQMSTRGICSLVQRSIASGEQLYGMAINHWRTAENRVPLGYAARAMLDGMPQTEYYAAYARALNIAQVEEVVGALGQLEEMDVFCRDNLFNIGFCHLGCWLNPKGMDWIVRWDDYHIQYVIDVFDEQRGVFRSILNETSPSAAADWLRLMINRLSTSITHLRLILTLHEISSRIPADFPGTQDADMLAWTDEVLDRADVLAEQYMEQHIACMPDRSCQGTLVSYAVQMPAYIDHARHCFVRGESPCPHKLTSLDAPPPPDVDLI